eukprot:scaffold127897_cov22-Tisochrysis_lutea.AAC.1
MTGTALFCEKSKDTAVRRTTFLYSLRGCEGQCVLTMGMDLEKCPFGLVECKRKGGMHPENLCTLNAVPGPG